MNKKDLNQIAKIEKAIKEKYGKDAIQNPKGNWDEIKEKKYLEELKNFYDRKKREQSVEKSEGFVTKSKIRKKDSKRNCPVCGKYSFSADDDVYINKFECCFECYIKYVEGREQRWKTGWRPNN